MQLTKSQEAAKKLLQLVADAIEETVKEAGPEGAPEVSIHLALQEAGLPSGSVKVFVDTMVNSGRIRRSNHTLYLPGEN